MKKPVKLLLVSVLACLCAACKEPIVHNLSESDANRLMTNLNEINIEAEKLKQPDGKWTVEVPGDESLRAIKFLNDSRLLREENPALNSKSSMLQTRGQQRYWVARALSRDIETTIASVEGVLEARVHLNLPPTDPLFDQPLNEETKGSASVLLITRKGVALDKDSVRDLVAGASGIPSKSIAVVMSSAAGALPIANSVQAVPPAETTNLSQSVDNTQENGVAGEEVQGTPAQAIANPEKSTELFGLSRSIILQIAVSLIIVGIAALYYVFTNRNRRGKRLESIANSLSSVNMSRGATVDA